MVKAEWGIKRICPNCGTRYYDFRKDPPTCPACGTVYDPDALLKSRRARPGMIEEVRGKAASKSAPPGGDFEELGAGEADVDADLPVEGADDGGEALIEDAAELGEDDIDAVEVEPGEDEE